MSSSNPHHLGQIHENIQQLGIVWCTQSRNRIPALSSLKALGAAARVITRDDIVHRVRVRVEHRVNEAHRPQSSRNALLVDQVDDASKDRCRSAGASTPLELAVAVDGNSVSVSCHIRICATLAVVQSTVCANCVVQPVARVGWSGGGEVIGYCVGLVVWDGVDVAEAARRVVAGEKLWVVGGDFGVVDCLAGAQRCRADGGVVGAGGCSGVFL